ncbi:MAG: glycosyltransferase [Thermoleophilaceae bacterium]
MAVLIASYSPHSGGSERLLLDVAAGLDEPPLIACPEGWLADRAREAGLVVLPLRMRSLHLRRSAPERIAAALRLAGHARELKRLCDDVRPEVLVAWSMRTAIAAAAAVGAGRDRPRLVFHHVDFLPGPAIARAVRAAAARADTVICISHALARDLDPDGRLSGRVEVIHPGVDLARFVPGQTTDAKRQDVLTLGAIVPWKRPDVALEIAATAARQVPQLRLRIAGDALDGGGDELIERLRRRAAEPDLAGHVEFTGPLSDPREALRDAGCLLHSSDREPFGLVVVEALASGTPVVAPAAGGPAEIVDASCGALYPPGDVQEGARALVGVLERRDELAGGARRRAETEFDLEEMQARYSQTLRKGSGAYSRVEGVAVVTVSHNSAPELGRLLSSAAAHLPGARVVVVDNASADDSVAVARRAGASVVENGENVGFGAAVNAALADVSEPVTVLVNPDVELIDDSLARLAGTAVDGRLHAPLLLGADGRRQDSAQPRPASIATALYAMVPGPLLPGPLRRVAEPWRSRRPRRVGWATAACIVARTETLKQLGPFDESIFLYAEDLDLGLRAAEAGVETWFHPDARAIHTGAHATLPAFGGEPYQLLAKQRREVVERRLGRPRARLDDVTQLATFANRRMLKRLTRRRTQREAAQIRALRSTRNRVP